MVHGGRKNGAGDRRRRRLDQPMSHENAHILLSSELPNQGARSLPTLPTLHSTKLATLGLDEVLVPATEPASVLSPLKFTQLTSGVRADEALASSGITPPTGAQPVEAASCSATLGKLLPARTRTSHFSTRSQLDQDSFTPMNGKRGQQTEERTHSHNTLLHQRREAARETHARRLEITRRRTTVAAASQSFFDRLASLPIREAIQLFTAQREALLEFCLQQFRGHVDAEELKIIHTDLLRITEKANSDLQIRLRALQLEEEQDVRKKQALQQLKESHQEQIVQHLAAAKDQRIQELAAREHVVKEQEWLDRMYDVREKERKRHIETHSEKLAEQIRDNAAARSTFKLAAQGSSPLYRTPWWSDESEERLKGFQRPTTVQGPSQSPVIYSKQRCQWYD